VLAYHATLLHNLFMPESNKPTCEEIGRQGGLVGGKAKVPKGFSMLSKKKRSAIARAAAKKRWASRHPGHARLCRGHVVHWDLKERETLCSTGELIDPDKLECAACHRLPTAEGHDPCIAALPPDVTSACCGHGYRKHCYVGFADDSVLRGDRAFKFFKESGKEPAPFEYDSMPECTKV
jgi:hypothetical protein